MEIDSDEKDRPRDLYAEFGDQISGLTPEECALQPVSPNFSVPDVRLNGRAVDQVRDRFGDKRIAAMVEGRFETNCHQIMAWIGASIVMPIPCCPSPVMALWRAIHGTSSENFSWQTRELTHLQNLFGFCACEHIEKSLPSQPTPARKKLIGEVLIRQSRNAEKRLADRLDQVFGAPPNLDDFLNVLWDNALFMIRLKEWYVMELFDFPVEVRRTFYSPDVHIPFAALSQTRRQALLQEYVNMMKYRVRMFKSPTNNLSYVQKAMKRKPQGDKWFTVEQIKAYAQMLQEE